MIWNPQEANFTAEQEHLELLPPACDQGSFLIGWFKRIYRRKTFLYPDTTSDGVNYWRERILFAVLVSGTGLSLMALVPAVYLASVKRLWVLLIADSSAFLLLVTLLVSRRVGLRLQAMTLLLMAFTIGVIVIWQLGFLSGGSAWLFAFSVMAGVFLGLRAAVAAILLNAAAFILLAWLAYPGQPPDQEFLTSFSRLTAAGLNFIFMNSVVAVVVAVLVDGLEAMNWKTAVARAALEEEKTALLKTKARLINEIAERKRTAMELERARDSAELANRAKSEFLANMSHELRTPLNHIIGFTEVVVDRKLGHLNPEQEEFLKDVLHSGHHLLFLINEILDLSEVDAGKMKLSLSRVFLRPLVENSLLMVKQKAIEHRLTMTSEIPDQPESFTADEPKLKKILYNLLSNAIKFTPEAGTVRVRAVPENAFSADSKGIRFSIIDSGIGLDRKDLERIFQPFEQADNSAGRLFQGTGLGLALTRRMVELHGGKIWAESEGRGKGSTFHFVLPFTSPT